MGLEAGAGNRKLPSQWVKLFTQEVGRIRGRRKDARTGYSVNSEDMKRVHYWLWVLFFRLLKVYCQPDSERAESISATRHRNQLSASRNVAVIQEGRLDPTKTNCLWKAGIALRKNFWGQQHFGMASRLKRCTKSIDFVRLHNECDAGITVLFYPNKNTNF